jgi:hypothetical protein
MTYPIKVHIRTLEQLAKGGVASRVSDSIAYTLLGKNFVDYATKYCSMRAVTMCDLETFADGQITTKRGGTWTAAPCFIDSVAHLAIFVMNPSETTNTLADYFITPIVGYRKSKLLNCYGYVYSELIPTDSELP